MIEIPENVNEYMVHCEKVYGNQEKEFFNVDLYYLINNYKIESPIEQLFCSALVLLIKTNYLKKNIIILPQENIGIFRVDFLLIKTGSDSKSLVVELDGHKFHDKNEEQRRYEKQRDRFLQHMNLPVFHYTGAEIVHEPINAALECLSYLTGEDKEDLLGIINYGYEVKE